jgi:hypothetical protein
VESTGDPIAGVDMVGQVCDRDPGYSIAILDQWSAGKKDVALVQWWAEPNTQVANGWEATKRRSMTVRTETTVGRKRV